MDYFKCKFSAMLWGVEYFCNINISEPLFIETVVENAVWTKHNTALEAKVDQ